MASDSGSESDGSSYQSDWTNEEEEYSEIKHQNYTHLVTTTIETSETKLSGMMRHRVQRASNVDEALPRAEILIDQDTSSGRNLGFRLRVKRDSASQTSIRSKIFRLDKNYPMNFVHDYTLGAVVEQSDIPLKDKFPICRDDGDNLTPDMIVEVSPNNFVVMEFGTNRGQSERAMAKDFKEKRLKYLSHLSIREDILKTTPGKEDTIIHFAILIVSENCVVSNVELKQGLVDEFCMRMRFAISQKDDLETKNLVKTQESELDLEMSKARQEIINFTMSKILSDRDLTTDGFPEYTSSNYKKLRESVDMQRFAKSSKILMEKAYEKSGLKRAKSDPLREEERYMQELLESEKQVVSEMTLFESECKKLNPRDSEKDIILMPFINMDPKVLCEDSEMDIVTQKLMEGLEAGDEAIREVSSGEKREGDEDDFDERVELIKKRFETGIRYGKIWYEAMTTAQTKGFHLSLAERMKKENEDDADGCMVDECSELREILDELESDEDGNDKDLLIAKNCHEMDAALRNGGVEKAYNDRALYHRVKLERLEKMDRLLLAKKGFQAKEFKDDEIVTVSKAKSKRPIRLDSKTSDIDDYIEDWHFFSKMITTNESLSTDTVFDLISESFKIQNGLQVGSELIERVRDVLLTRIGVAMTIITSIAMEINASIKQHCKKDQVIVKKVREYPVWLMIKPTNSQSHLFYSILWDQADDLNVKSRQGGSYLRLYRNCTRIFSKTISLNMVNEGLVCTPFYSVNKSKLPNLCQAQSRFVTAFAYAANESKVCLLREDEKLGLQPINLGYTDSYDPVQEYEESLAYAKGTTDARANRIRKMWKLICFISMVSLHNKAEVEEHLSLLRFVMMEGFVHKPAVPKPWKMIQSFKTHLRSRLSIWVIYKLVDLMKEICRTGGYRLEKKKTIGSRRVLDSRVDMMNPFIDEVMEDEGEAINSFYYGYTVDKNQIPEKNQSAQMFEKILVYEDLFKDEDIGSIGFDNEEEDVLNIPFHYYSINMIKGMSKHLLDLLQRRFGVDPKKKIESTFLSLYTRMTIFDTLSTMKASTDFNCSNEEPDSPRPRRGKLMELSKDLIYSGKTYMYQVVVGCLIKLLKQKSIYNDLFKKNQHGGLREIYIMSSDTRVVQHLIETMSRAACSLFRSETMTNPRSKTELLREHSDKSREKFGVNSSITLCTSDDARKWNQGHYVHKFYVMMIHLFPDEYHDLIRAICYLWQNKKILIDESLISVFKSHPEPCFKSPILEVMRKVSRGEVEAVRWMKHGSRYIMTRTGMMQGILHYTSSLFHTMVNESVKTTVTNYIKELILEDPGLFIKNYKGGNEKGKYSSAQVEPVVTVLQSSDDSCMMITTPTDSGFTQNIMSYVSLMMFNYKHLIGSSVGIHLSVKSTVNTLNIMEFNSNWFILGNRFNPYIKQCLASLTVSESGNLLMRMQENNNAITSALENGASSLCCSLLQIAQAMQHYLFMGSSMTHNFIHYSTLLRSIKLPTLGFFLMEHPCLAGLSGFEYLHYSLALRTNLKHYYKSVFEKCQEVSTLEEKRKIINEDTLAPSLHNTICQLSHGQNHKLSRLKESMELPEDWLETLNENPAPLVRRAKSEEESKLKVAAKLHSPGMENSFNSSSIISNIAAESVYILSSKCNFVRNTETLSVLSNWGFLNECQERKRWDERIGGQQEHFDLEGVKKFSLMSIAAALFLENNKIKEKLKEVEGTSEGLAELQESILYVKNCFGRSEDYDIMLDNADSLGAVQLYRDDKNLKNRALRIKVTTDSLIDDLKPYDIVVWRLLGERTIRNRRSAEYAWRVLKLKYTWLKETWQETLLRSPFTNSVQLLNFLSRLDKSGREVKLLGVPIFTSHPGDKILNLVGCNLQKGFSTSLVQAGRYKTENPSSSTPMKGSPGEHNLRRPRIRIMMPGEGPTVRTGAHFLTMSDMLGLTDQGFKTVVTNLSKSIQLNPELNSKRMQAYNILFGLASDRYTTAEVIDLCQKKNLGLIGGYSIPQYYDVVTNQYLGWGVWEGKYDGTSIQIIITSIPTGKEYTRDELQRFLEKANKEGSYKKKDYKIREKIEYENVLIKVKLSSEVVKAELESLISRWCETNRVSNTAKIPDGIYKKYAEGLRGVREITERERYLASKFRDSETEKIIRTMHNFRLYPHVEASAPGARVGIDPEYRGFGRLSEMNMENELTMRVEENHTIRINMPCPRSEVEYVRSPGRQSMTNKMMKPRSFYTILSVTPNMKDLNFGATVKKSNVNLSNHKFLEHWCKDNPLSISDAFDFLNDLTIKFHQDRLSEFFDMSKLLKRLRMITKRWLRLRKLVKDSPNPSSDDDAIYKRPTSTLDEDSEIRKLDSNVDMDKKMMEAVQYIRDQVVIEGGKMEKEKDEMDAYNSPIEYWTTTLEEELREDVNLSRVSHERVEAMRIQQVIENSLVLERFLDNIDSPSWKVILESSIIPQVHKEKKEVLELLLSTEKEKVTLKTTFDVSSTKRSEFPPITSRWED